MQVQREAFLPAQLHIPGKVVHLRKIGREKDRSRVFGGAQRVFVPVVEPDLEHFSYIKVSTSMITDHLPDLYVSELHAMLYDWGIERKKHQHQHVGLDPGFAGSRV